ncbi:hypothetical protein U0070_000420, partial [Myodes glareolus]
MNSTALYVLYTYSTTELDPRPTGPLATESRGLQGSLAAVLCSPAASRRTCAKPSVANRKYAPLDISVPGAESQTENRPSFAQDYCPCPLGSGADVSIITPEFWHPHWSLQEVDIQFLGIGTLS